MLGDERYLNSVRVFMRNWIVSPECIALAPAPRAPHCAAAADVFVAAKQPTGTSLCP